MIYTVIGEELVLSNPSQRIRIPLSLRSCEISLLPTSILISGGFSAISISDQVQEYSLSSTFPPTSVNLTSIGTLKVGRFNHTQTLALNHLYIIGGSLSSRQPISHCEKFDLLTHQSSAITELPFGVMLHSALLSNNRIFIAGGLKSRGSIPEKALIDIFYLDLLNEEWNHTPMNYISAYRPCLAPIGNDYIFIFGGWTKESQFSYKSFAFDVNKMEIKPFTEFSFGEVYSSYCVNGDVMSLMDVVGGVHKIYVPKVKMVVEYKFKYKVKWERRKAFILAYSYFRGTRGVFSLPEMIIREIVRCI